MKLFSLQRLTPGRLFLVSTVIFVGYASAYLGHSYFSAKRDLDRIRQIVASEELILALNERLQSLSRSVLDLELPNAMARDLFLDSLQHNQVQPPLIDDSQSVSTELASLDHWSVTTVSPSGAAGPLRLWKHLLAEIDYFQHAKFYAIRGEFSDPGSLSDFHCDVGFKGLARLRDGRWSGVRAKLQLVWRRSINESSQAPPGGASSAPQSTSLATDATQWRIAQWNTKSVRTSTSDRTLFAEALAFALPDDQSYRRARTSEHELAVVEFYQNGAGSSPWDYFTPISANQRPGISVVDIDRDGFDDLYIAVRRGRNQLLRNRGDGTFEEVAARWGLDIPHFSSCSIFADFDNDGDADLMLGRSFERTTYLENNGQRFVRSMATDPNRLPFLVTSMSAADVNQDGLLDIYCCTYRPAVLESIISEEQSANQEASQAPLQDHDANGVASAVAQDSTRWPQEFLSSDQAREYERRLRTLQKTDANFSTILDQVGPPNVMLINQGNGRFTPVESPSPLSIWRNSLQATWADFDEDGDPDLYVANDWAGDTLLRNDGNGQFVDVTQELGITEFGFGMGVSWGDFDRDGLQDIYVSNMYSKAGRRITAQIAELNPDYQRSVDGNYLYRNSASGFRCVSGLESPGITVAEAGWSWGGQFADFDNDGYLDIYALSGYFTAPAQFRSNVDL